MPKQSETRGPFEPQGPQGGQFGGEQGGIHEVRFSQNPG